MSDYQDLIALGKFGTILADPPWLFENRTGKVAPEHKRLYRYHTMTNEEILEMPVSEMALAQSHLYLWVPNALIELGLQVMKAWGFDYKTMLIWYKIRKDGGPDRRGVGFYFRNVTEVILFGVRGKLRTLPPGRRQENIIISRKRGHSIKPDEIFTIIEDCSPGPYLELFARRARPGWSIWGDEAPDPSDYQIQLALPLWVDKTKQRISDFEQKYGMNFGEFEIHRKQGGFPEETRKAVEKDYQEWEAISAEYLALEKLSPPKKLE